MSAIGPNNLSVSNDAWFFDDGFDDTVSNSNFPESWAPGYWENILKLEGADMEAHKKITFKFHTIDELELEEKLRNLEKKVSNLYDHVEKVKDNRIVGELSDYWFYIMRLEDSIDDKEIFICAKNVMIVSEESENRIKNLKSLIDEVRKETDGKKLNEYCSKLAVETIEDAEISIINNKARYDESNKSISEKFPAFVRAWVNLYKNEISPQDAID